MNRRLPKWLARRTNCRSAALIFSLLPCGLTLCSAKELISLKNGFQIEADSHRVFEGVVTLELASGSLQFEASDIAGIEPLPDIAIPASAASVGMERSTPEQIVRQAGASQATAIQFTELVLSVAKVESGLKQDAISPKGAQGLMQLMPQTAVALGVDAHKAAENALGGAAYLRALLERYGNNAVLALAAYNAGPAAVQKYGGVPPYIETQRYIERVLREYSRLEEGRHLQRNSSGLICPPPQSSGRGIARSHSCE
jgi:soluble lytic murein transglycosylase-like protein